MRQAAVAVPAMAPLAPRLRGWAERQFRYLVLAPALALLVLISAFPVAYNAVVSTQSINLLSNESSFVGIANYEAVATDPRFWGALGHTLAFIGLALPLQVVAGLALAVLFSGDLPGKRWFVALLILPAMISPIVAGAAWRLMFDNRYGPVNQILGWLAGRPVDALWTIDPNLVYPAIVVVEVWQHTPFVFLLTLAALESVDRSLLEAAEIDGASSWTIFRRIVLPLIWPVLSMVILIRALDLTRLFEIVWTLTRGGPGTMTETISIYTYRLGFEHFEIGYAAAVALVLSILLAAAMLFGLRRVEVLR